MMLIQKKKDFFFTLKVSAFSGTTCYLHQGGIKFITFVCYFAKYLQSILPVLFACLFVSLFVCLQYN